MKSIQEERSINVSQVKAFFFCPFTEQLVAWEIDMVARAIKVKIDAEKRFVNRNGPAWISLCLGMD